ncbi:DUF362 domain-containing protein [Clostridium coskatii]|uniref:DUF362 domain-containing protein n=1 Tax=Clostridium coskatii TaxID=1705578 RepID=A0A170NNX3_9CLOT|nr:DUF362 domain-containing protein [Clostridium coskatii]OAA94199.1 hypothetical protein WX73_03346 [Clostridium coskatii]OBR95531.1 hypothetical protein CLCOS_13240 [Clostridium coskatii]
MENNILSNGLVGIYENRDVNKYFEEAPFNPSEKYSEYKFKDCISLSKNYIYSSVRECLKLLNLDIKNYNKENWNPLKTIIKPGDKVVIKPNFVLDKHNYGGNIWSIITHPSIIRAIVDYVYIALNGKGHIIIADAPQADCDFNNFLKISKIETIKKLYKEKVNFDIEIYDLRQVRYVVNHHGFLDSNSRIYQNGDPLGYEVVDLTSKSEFSTLNNYDKIYGADYDRSETIKHHTKDKNEYCISKTVLSADVIISVPKIKTHRKAGVTLNLKNLVGINGNKNYLPHFQIGTPENGGDEFPQLNNKQKIVFYTNRKLIDKLLARPNLIKDKIYGTSKFLYKFIKKMLKINIETKNVISAGNWYGNDTTWRMVVDLNKILIYSDKVGNMRNIPQRRFISFVDGIIAGEGEGPLIPDSKPCGIIACGFNPYVVDITLTKLMGINYKKLKKFQAINKLINFRIFNCDIDKVVIKSNNSRYECLLKNDSDKFLQFKLPRGWRNKIEL